MDQIIFLDYAGVAVFAATGALAASRKELDVIGFLFLAGVTGVGGGTFRDLILDVPVFWVQNHDYLLVCAAIAVAVYFSAHLIESRYRLLLWLDAVGLAAYCVFGAWKGLVVTGSAMVAIVMGMLTATFGGILRDILSGEPSVLLRPEIYVTSAMAGAVTFTVLDIAGLPLLLSAAPAFLVAFAIRGGALRFGWSFPPYKSRPGRRPEDIP
ncbi:trimeric intracellular cation channel family protein [Neoaquamicrobium sediminum]|uniref:Trimeric intracellular cation channel family protein n=1 Tax=Neoaquamicrobium sediminum TaxID=1849104 RepID=A0ABV3WPS1_9HYPH